MTRVHPDPPVVFGRTHVRFPSEQLGELRDANGLLGDPPALRARMAEDGYLLLRGLIDPEKVRAARGHVLGYMAEHEAMEPGSRPLDGVMGEYGKGVPMMGRELITHAPPVRAAVEADELFDFYRGYFGGPARTFDYKWLRAVGHDRFTGVHYDVVYMGRGSANLHTAWVPLGDIPVHQGTLAICVGSHNAPEFEPLRRTYGRLDVDRDRTAGWFTEDPCEIVEKFGGQWCTTDVHPGDVITFGMYTLHASTTNTTDRWRLSCDVRFQPASDPVDDRWAGDRQAGHTGGPERPMSEARAAWGL